MEFVVWKEKEGSLRGDVVNEEVEIYWRSGSGMIGKWLMKRISAQWPRKAGCVNTFASRRDRWGRRARGASARVGERRV